MRYLFIDRILRLRKDHSISTLKNAALSEDVYNDHFFGFPVMPGALQIEAMAQAGTALLEVSSGFTKKALLIMVEQAKFRAIVRPGDQLTIAMTVLASEAEMAQMDGTISVGERVVTNARLTFTVKDDAVYYPRTLRHLVQSIYDVWLQDAVLENFDAPPGARDA
jgi:3-hydroxyacyl-[acyl-carrier-protein] dehydratase